MLSYRTGHLPSKNGRADGGFTTRAMCHIPRAIDPVAALPRPLPLKDRLALSIELITLSNPSAGDVTYVRDLAQVVRT